jgi:hypothetical protein
MGGPFLVERSAHRRANAYGEVTAHVLGMNTLTRIELREALQAETERD